MPARVLLCLQEYLDSLILSLADYLPSPSGYNFIKLFYPSSKEIFYLSKGFGNGIQQLI